jgi:hypothetical protein
VLILHGSKDQSYPDAGPAPDLSALRYGEPVELFNGRDLTGWSLIGEGRTNGFKVVNGTLYNDANQIPGEPRISFGNLRTNDELRISTLNLKLTFRQEAIPVFISGECMRSRYWTHMEGN